MERVFYYQSEAEVCGKLGAIITTPTGFDPAKEKLPVIVFLHGAGERGDGSPEQVEIVKVNGVPKLFSADPDYKGLRVITVSPQCPVNMVWNHLVYPLMKWIKEVVAMLNGDEDRVSITGLSMGGFGTWDMLMTFPEAFSCGAPVCGGGLSWRTDALKGMKIRAYHGLDDELVPFNNSMEMVMTARKHGAKVVLTAYDKVGHASWVPAYEETDMIEWLAAQKRG
ncbi:MAG: dienelactone hydrolase family protein [Clostridia bacterium]|nr:dienelactone hydrolase family protein [Clostridia bacterium]